MDDSAIPIESLRANESLRAKIDVAFADVEPPDAEDLIALDCPECRAVRRVFRNEDRHEIKPRKIEWGYDKLPLFTPRAFQYFLPAFMLYSLENPSSDVCQYTIYGLALHEADDEWWQERINRFTKEQIAACNLFLKWIYPHPDYAYDSKMIERALERWWQI